jgi:L-rhamnose mutarotase
LSVRAGADTECHKPHNPIWPELEKVLKGHGVLNYSIFLHTETHQLFGYAEIESEEQWVPVGLTEACQGCWQHMGDAKFSGRLTRTCKLVSCIT